jgi:hypothetical protein
MCQDNPLNAASSFFFQVNTQHSYTQREYYYVQRELVVARLHHDSILVRMDLLSHYLLLLELTRER